MYVHHLLPAVLSDIELEPISRDFHLLPEVTSKQEKSGNYFAIGCLHVRNRLDMSLGDKEHMDASFWVDVIDDEIIFILVHRSCWNFVIDNRTEKTHKMGNWKNIPCKYTQIITNSNLQIKFFVYIDAIFILL